MKHSLKGQMQIIAHAKTVIDTVGMPDELKASLKDGLNDAYSTIAALNLNSNIFERVKELEEALNWTLIFVRDLRYPEQHEKKEAILKLLNSKP